MLQTWLHALPYLLGAGFLTWLVSVQQRNVTIVDTLWSLMFVIAAFVYAAVQHAARAARAIAAGAGHDLGTAPGASTSGVRTYGHEEDRRYQKIRRRNEPGFTWKSLYLVFGLQAVLAWIISLPLLGGIVGDASPLGVLDYAGAALWLVGFYFEAVGDWQLGAFQGGSRQCRPGHGPRAVGPHAPSQLFR